MGREKTIPSEPCVRRVVVPAFRQAIVDLWGQPGREQVAAALSGDARDEFLRDVTENLEWFPTRHLIAWAFAVWEGPAERSRDAMAEFVRRQWDLSFGVIRKLLLQMTSPSTVVPRLAKIWKEDHTAGELVATLDENGRGATIEIIDSPFVETPHGRASMAEIYRHAFAQTRAKNVTESHALDGANRMVIRLRWE